MMTISKLTIKGTLRALSWGMSAMVSSVITPLKSQFFCKQGKSLFHSEFQHLDGQYLFLVWKGFFFNSVAKTYFWYAEHRTWTTYIGPLCGWPWLQVVCCLLVIFIFSFFPFS